MRRRREGKGHHKHPKRPKNNRPTKAKRPPKHPRRRKFRLGHSKAYHPKKHAKSAEISLKNGWGQIGVEPYYPFIPVHRFAGSGFSGRIICPRTGELVHCHSKGEINWCRFLLWSDGHYRLYSQVALPRQATWRIAKALGVKHPRYPDGTLAVMTTDFVHVTEADGEEVYAAYSIKRAPEAVTKRKLQLLSIEQTYFLEQGIPWHLRFRDQVDQVVLANIRTVSAFVGVSPLIWGSDCWRKFEPSMFKAVSQGLPLNTTCHGLETTLGMPAGTALTLVRFFIANRIWKIDWTKCIDPLTPLVITGRQPRITL